MRVSAIMIVIVLAAVSLARSAAPPAAPAPLRAVPGDAQDLVLLLDARPYLIRLHLQVHGRSYQKSWDETVGHLFRFLDVDGDGVLSKKEAALAPSNAQWVQLMNGVTVEPDAAPDFGDAMTVSREKFLRYYRDSGAGALQIEWGWRPPAQDRLSDALFKQLDKDTDGALSREELNDAAAALHALDRDGDEIIRAVELDPSGMTPAFTFTFRASTDAQQVPHDFPFVILHDGDRGDALVRALLARYDRNKDQKLSRDELPLEKAMFDRLDKNHDGRLDAGELAGWRNLSPDLEMIVPLEHSARQDILVLPSSEEKPRRLAAVMPPGRDGSLRIPVDEKQLELVRSNTARTIRQNLLKQFDGVAGKSGILTEKVIYQPPFPFVALLRLADRNGDNQLSRQELADFLDLQEKFFFRSSYLTVVDRGPSLFEFLDTDHDGRLSPRELRSAWTRLEPWDRAHTGRITRQQVPRQFQMVLSHGQPRSHLSPVGPGYADMPLFRDRARGPLWFRKMDRNGDGDVSPREFLGTAEQFRRIDCDGDGLIDADEAARADQGARKKP